MSSLIHANFLQVHTIQEYILSTKYFRKGFSTTREARSSYESYEICALIGFRLQFEPDVLISGIEQNHLHHSILLCVILCWIIQTVLSSCSDQFNSCSRLSCAYGIGFFFNFCADFVPVWRISDFLKKNKPKFYSTTILWCTFFLNVYYYLKHNDMRYLYWKLVRIPAKTCVYVHILWVSFWKYWREYKPQAL